MFDDLGIVREAISDTELLILSIGEGKEIIVQTSKDYVSSIRAELNDEDGETIIVEYDLKTKVVNESIIN